MQLAFAEIEVRRPLRSAPMYKLFPSFRICHKKKRKKMSAAETEEYEKDFMSKLQEVSG